MERDSTGGSQALGIRVDSFPCLGTGGGRGATQERKEKQLCGTELHSLRAPRCKSVSH